MMSSIGDLIQDARALQRAEQLALQRGQPEVAALLGESRRLTLARLLRSHPDHATHSAEGQVVVRGEGIVGTLTVAEAVAAGVAL